MIQTVPIATSNLLFSVALSHFQTGYIILALSFRSAHFILIRILELRILLSSSFAALLYVNTLVCMLMHYIRSQFRSL